MPFLSTIHELFIMVLKYTREQQLALSDNRHMAVTANAGSGKTKVLVDKYIQIIENDRESQRQHDPGKIIAITFTKKAAAEMKAKAIRSIEKKLAAEADSAIKRKLMKIREKLTYAKISTIHSFCTQILRDYPIEAEVDPNFTELGESDSLMLINDGIQFALEEFLDDNNPDAAETSELISIYGRRKIEGFIRNLLNERNFAALEKIYENSDEQIVDRALDRFRTLIYQKALPILEETLDLSGSCSQNVLNNGKKKNSFDSAVKSVRSCLDAIKDNNADAAAFAPSLTNIRKTKIGNKLFLTLIEASDSVKKTFENIIDSCDVFNLKGQEAYPRQARLLLRIAKTAGDYIDEEKYSMGAIDFNDMLRKAHDVLLDDEVRDMAISGIRHILVDEFQDTDSLQYEIIKRLVPSIQDPSAGGPTLFIVGDAKQSIYGFRNADVRVFKEAIEHIAASNSSKINSGKLKIQAAGLSKKELFGNITLNTSFRLKPAVAQFVNQVCGPLFEKDQTEFDVDYDDLIFGRHSVDFIRENNLKEDSLFPLKPEHGSVTFLLAEKINRRIINEDNDKEPENDDADNSKKEEINEGELLARHLILSIKKGLPIHDEENIPRPAGFGDIAVLARSRNKFNDLILALIKNKIPYVVHSGTGFYATQEVIDISSYLKYLYDDNDSLSLAGVLLSDFFGLSDDELYRIVTQNEGETLNEKFTAHCERILDKDDRERYPKHIRAYYTLQKMKRHALSMPVSQLIIKILEESYWYAAVAANSSLEMQIKSNVKKLIAFARDFEARGYRTLIDFVHELEILEDASKEGEAPFIKDADAVNIMTMHASKGLEFPVVYIYNSDSTTPPHKDGIFTDDQFGICLKPRKIDPDTRMAVDDKSVLYDMAKMRRKEAETAEDKRILYVAMTRAKDHLIISGSLQIKKESVTATGQLKSILESLYLEPSGMEINHHPLISKLKIYDPEGDITISMTSSVEVIREIKEQEALETSGDKLVNPSILLGKNVTFRAGEQYSATRLHSYLHEKNTYARRYVLGLPEEGEPEPEERQYIREDKDIVVSANVAGTLIHAVMENAKYWIEAGKPDRTKLEEFILSTASALYIQLNENLFARTVNEALNCAKTDLIRRNWSSFLKAENEYRIILPAGDDFTLGFIDCMVEISPGYKEAWDWKSNRLESASDIKETAKKYELQMKMYAWMLSRIYPGQSEYKTRLLFTSLAAENAKDEDWSYTYSWTKEETEEIGQYLLTVIDDLEHDY